jgi:hypothetical protein
MIGPVKQQRNRPLRPHVSFVQLVWLCFFFSRQKVVRPPAALPEDGLLRQRYRQRAIDYGRNTIGYDVYTKTIPKYVRMRYNKK